jgi:hypothetical protein
MNGKVKFEMQCAEFEALLAEAVEDTLRDELRAAFAAHHASCSRCAPLYAEAELGWRGLKALQREEVAPPAQLMENILRATSRAPRPETQARLTWWQRVRELPILGPILHTTLQPRLALSCAMVFVSLAAVFSFSGNELRDFRYADLRPSALRHDFYEVQGKMVKYYENIRFVYELESRMREFKREAAPPEPKPQPEPRKELKHQSGPPGLQQQMNRNAENDTKEISTNVVGPRPSAFGQTENLARRRGNTAIANYKSALNFSAYPAFVFPSREDKDL